MARPTALTPDFRTFLTRGYNAGAWNGTNLAGAINSSLAAQALCGDGVGYGLGSEIGISTIGGVHASHPATCCCATRSTATPTSIKASTSRILGILATNWQGTSKAWAQGDFNYDGSVDVT